ncbi:MAG: flagellar type III secretion system pore protein FliP [Planctomycetes bacterium]|nr:flagellar type III secretion system pore protein FliP [Planctomycetota bacterium]
MVAPKDKRLAALGALFLACFFFASPCFAQEGGLPIPSGGIETATPGQVATALEILAVLTVLTLAPAIVVLTTGFTRVVVVLSFLRRALATQQLPPNTVIIGLSLFLTFAVMSPTYNEVWKKGVRPYLNRQIDQKTAVHRSLVPIRRFMFKHTREKDLRLFISLDEDLRGRTDLKRADIATLTLIPAFVLSEIRLAFWMGFLLYLPFLVIDMVVASVLMSMGMLMLPPMMVSVPFKLLLFVLVDGWYLVVGELLRGFA